MLPLTRDQRRTLLTVLTATPLFSTAAGRQLLWAGLPPRLLAALPHGDSAQVDLTLLVDACAGWQAADLMALHPLLVLIENAADVLAGSTAAPPLRALWAALAGTPLPEPPADESDTPRPARPPPDAPGTPPAAAGGVQFYGPAQVYGPVAGGNIIMNAGAAHSTLDLVALGTLLDQLATTADAAHTLPGTLRLQLIADALASKAALATPDAAPQIAIRLTPLLATLPVTPEGAAMAALVTRVLSLLRPHS